MKRKIRVNTSKPYDVIIGSSVICDVAEFLKKKGVSEVYVVTDSNVGELHLENVADVFKRYDIATSSFTFEAGESSKNILTLKKIYDFLVDRMAERMSYLIALGGGVVGDITGFAASTYMRGIRLVQIPTSLLAMVDASIGGKTAINHDRGKNLIGSFYQPDAVFIDVDFLETLPDREFRSAIAEVVKYGVIKDRKLFEFLEGHAGDILNRDRDMLIDSIAMSVSNKVAIVEEDERESGVRALLNFGHTFGHSLEAVTGYNRYLHGEAVSIGEALATVLSEKMGMIEAGERNRIIRLLSRFGLPVGLPCNVDAKLLLSSMNLDKKVKGKRVFFVLTKGIGESTISGEVPESLVAETIEECREGRFPD